MDKVGYIYKITSPTGKIYIGKTVRLNDRISCYRNLSGISEQKIIYNSIKKHGWETHTFEVIAETDSKKLSELEIYYIEKYNSYHYNNENGMNLTKGGDGSLGRKDTPEVIEKRAKHAIGRKHKEETKRLMSLRKKGKPSSRKGIACSESAKQKISKANKNKVKTQESIEKEKKTRLKNLIEKHGAVLQIDLNTNEVVKEWMMLPKDIGKYFTNKESNIHKCLNNQVRQAYNYKWKYKK